MTQIPLVPPFSKGEEIQCVSEFVAARQVPLFEKEGLGEICGSTTEIQRAGIFFVDLLFPSMNSRQAFGKGEGKIFWTAGEA
jgi:hypothetical protein